MPNEGSRGVHRNKKSMVVTVLDYVPDIVMSSLETCNVNCGEPFREGRGRIRGKGRAVYHQPGKSVDEHSHHELQKGISKLVKGVIASEQTGGMRELAMNISMGITNMCFYSYVLMIIKVVFRL
jgi:hypothetical protein